MSSGVPQAIRQPLAVAELERQHLAAQRLVAHRELQLQRAYVRGRGWYIRERERKLAQARARLAAVEARRMA